MHASVEPAWVFLDDHQRLLEVRRKFTILKIAHRKTSACPSGGAYLASKGHDRLVI